MRSSWKALVAVAVGLLVAPQLAVADDVQEQLLQMQERMSQLEDKLAATEDELEDSKRRSDQQEQLIERAGLEERDASSGMASFFESVEFGGWVAGSYWWNLHQPNNGTGVGANGGAPGSFGTGVLAATPNPFHPDHNTFQLDQLWFEMAKPATEESRGGFAADLVIGKTSDTLTGGGGDGNGNDFTVYQAYAEYLAPIGPGVNVKAGRFATHIGAEVAQTVYNYNITRGLVYSILQPFNHVGVFASTSMDNGLSFGAGVANTPFANLNTDTSDEKAYQWTAGFSQEGWGISYNGQYGKVGAAGTTLKAGINDLVINWDPSENLSTWANVTHVWLNGSGLAGDPYAVGLALAGRLALTEATGFALRGEYLFGNKSFFVAGTPGDQHLWSITGTLDHALAENLTLRGEVRYEEGASKGSNKIFYADSSSATPVAAEQVLLGLEMIYQF